MPQDARDESSVRMRTIMMATDFSQTSARARDYASALAAPGAALTFVHAHLLPLPAWPEAHGPDWMPPEPGPREETLERLQLFAAPARAEGRSLKLLLREGLPADVILAQAAALQPDLIAMGTHGRKGFERRLMGSTAERVLREATKPVLVASALAAAPPPRIRAVLCALGLEAGSATLGFAIELARRCGSRLTVMHVLEGFLHTRSTAAAEKGAREELLELLTAARCGVATEILVRSGHPSGEILRAAGARAADIVVMGVHDRRAAQVCGLGVTTEQVLREAGCAVIAVPSAVGKRSSEARMACVGANA